MPGDAFSWSSCCEQNEVMFEAISLPSSLAAMPLSLQADKSVSRAALTKTCSTQLGDPKGIYYWGRAPHRHHKSANSVLIEAFEGSTQRSCGALDGPEFQRANSSFSLYRHLVLQFILLYLISEISKSTTTEICQLFCAQLLPICGNGGPFPSILLRSWLCFPHKVNKLFHASHDLQKECLFSKKNQTDPWSIPFATWSGFMKGFLSAGVLEGPWVRSTGMFNSS